MAVVEAPLGWVVPQVMNQVAQVMEQASSNHFGRLSGLFSQGSTLKSMVELADGFAAVLGLTPVAI